MLEEGIEYFLPDFGLVFLKENELTSTSIFWVDIESTTKLSHSRKKLVSYNGIT